MKVEINNNINFCARIDKKFVNSTENFYLKRNLPVRYNIFKKSLEKFETYGSPDSEIVYVAQNKGNGFLHLLCLKNTKINKKSALILTKSDKYTDVVNFFTNITDNMMLEWEKLLGQA